MTQHRIDASPTTVHWGHFDATLKPVLAVDSGDTVTISSVSGLPSFLPDEKSGYTVAPALRAIHEAVESKGPHICTGPVAVRGAKPGDTLEVRIKSVELHDDWGYNLILPDIGGALSEDFTDHRAILIGLDSERMIGRLPFGVDVPLRPFFGVMGVAPSPSAGSVSSVPPGRHGGNIDNKELIAGTTLFLPVHTEGALFSAGDGHGTQGDGEVCLTAIETGLIGTFELHLHPGRVLDWPYAETPTHLITMAFDPDLDVCATTALREMIAAICARTGLSREDAYTLCSLAADLRITQVVNGNKGVHCMLEKRYLRS
jgi:acetamidase/formamidase